MLGSIPQGAIAAVLATAMTCPTARASTAVYTFGGLLSGNLQGCLSNAKSAATKAGFTENQQEVLDTNQKAGDFHASKPGSPLAMSMRCDPTIGVYSIGISGVDSQATFESLRAVVKGL